VAKGEQKLGSPQHSWAWSVVEAVGEVADRDVRWDGTVVVRAADISPIGYGAVSRMHQLQTYVELDEADADAIGDASAHARSKRPETAEQVQARWSALVQATGHATAEVIRLTAPPIRRENPEAYSEAALHHGLGDVWVTPPRLIAVWEQSESARLTLYDDPEQLSFDYTGDEPAASAARDVIAEIARQQGRLPTESDYAVISDELLQVDPGRLFDEVVEQASVIHGTRADMPRDKAVETLRNDFLAAVEQGNPGAGTPDSAAARAVRAVTAESLTHVDLIDRRLAQLASDPALTPLAPGRAQRSDGAQQSGDPAVRRGQRPEHGPAARG
jgi:hypothetical protein